MITPAPAPAASQPEKATIAYPDFRGTRVEPGAFVTIQSDPVVINRLGVRVHLHRVEWISVEGPNGSEEKEGTAHLIVERNGADKSIQLDEGETKSALGVSVTVQKVSEEYDKDKLDFRPLVTLKVE